MNKPEKYLYNRIIDKNSDFVMWMAFPGIYSFTIYTDIFGKGCEKYEN